jgi:hypothetical protein
MTFPTTHIVPFRADLNEELKCRDFFETLPDELILKILNELPLSRENIITIKLLNKRFYVLACDKTIWNRLSFTYVGKRTDHQGFVNELISKKANISKEATRIRMKQLNSLNSYQVCILLTSLIASLVFVGEVFMPHDEIKFFGSSADLEFERRKTQCTIGGIGIWCLTMCLFGMIYGGTTYGVPYLVEKATKIHLKARKALKYPPK